MFFANFKWYLGGLGVFGGMAWTIQTDSLELWWDLVLHGMGEVDFHVFGKYWKLTSSPNTSKLILGPPGWSSDFFESQGTISRAIKPINFPRNDPKQKSGDMENLPKSAFAYKMILFVLSFVGPYRVLFRFVVPFNSRLSKYVGDDLRSPRSR